MKRKSSTNKASSVKEKTEGFKPGYLITAFTPLLITVIIEAIAYLAAFAILYTIKSRSGETLFASNDYFQDAFENFFNNPVSNGLLYLLKYSLMLIIFGYWYYEVFCNSAEKGYVSFKDKPVYKFLLSPNTVLFIVSGYLLQVFVTCALKLLEGLIPSAFTGYNEIIDTMAGTNVSLLMVITVSIIAPIAEEIIFRGISLKYINRALCLPGNEPINKEKPLSFNKKIIFSVILQALFFGLYHGNLIQGTYAFIIGALLGIIAIITNSIVPGIILHAIINISVYLIPETLTNSNIKLISFMIMSLVLVVIIFRFLINHFSDQMQQEKS